jgi:hypothetical protein
LVEQFKDARITRKVKNVTGKMVANQTTQLWTISSDKREFERMRDLFNGRLKSVLDDEKVSTALREEMVIELGNSEVVYALHDPCDIRKRYSEKLENLGIVRDLEGKLIHGYSSFNTVCVSLDGKKTQLSDITVFSNGDGECYVHQKELDELERKQNKAAKSDTEADLTEREKAIVELLETGAMINLRQVTRTQMQRVSQKLKEENENLQICHVLDRQFDGLPYFQFIEDDLDDSFVIRMKISRNSNETSVNEDKKEVAVKLKDVLMPNTRREVLDKVILGNKVYQQVKRVIEWGTLTLEGKAYSVVRITLFTRNGKEIFPQPMLLITNYTISNYQQSLGVYRIYLQRAKIEGVFKFVKNALGWEDFQVRDWESIKNIIALAFFIGGYFYEIEPALAHNPGMEWVCALGGGKGTLSRHFFLEGLKNLLIHQQVERFREKSRLKPTDWTDVLEFAL